jgi:hypothetical protein
MMNGTANNNINIEWEIFLDKNLIISMTKAKMEWNE